MPCHNTWRPCQITNSYHWVCLARLLSSSLKSKSAENLQLWFGLACLCVTLASLLFIIFTRIISFGLQTGNFWVSVNSWQWLEMIRKVSTHLKIKFKANQRIVSGQSLTSTTACKSLMDCHWNKCRLSVAKELYYKTGCSGFAKLVSSSGIELPRRILSSINGLSLDTLIHNWVFMTEKVSQAFWGVPNQKTDNKIKLNETVKTIYDYN